MWQGGLARLEAIGDELQLDIIGQRWPDEKGTVCFHFVTDRRRHGRTERELLVPP
jgi:hypothetical protein